MTVTAPAATGRDAKAGFCSRCRNGQHMLCASPEDRCGCPFKEHPNRPTPTPPASAGAHPSMEPAAHGPAPSTPSVAALCGYCRGRNHMRCTSAACSCTGPSHPNRPGAEPGRAGRPAKAPKVEPVWELVKELVKAAPPPKAEKPKKPTPAELAQPMLEIIAEAGDRDSWRIALFGTAIAATKARKALAEAFVEEWEWTSARDEEGRPAVFVRWLGAAAGDES